MKKQNLIDNYLLQPIKIGDDIEVRGLGIQNKNSWGNCTKVVSLGENNSVFIKQYGYKELIEVKEENYRKTVNHIGYNPFPEKLWNSSLRIVAYNLGSILGMFIDRKSKTLSSETFGDVIVPEINWNPILIDKSGNDIEYQRDFCWTITDKQLLISSIYNNIDIGKIVVRSRSWEWVKKRIAEGKPAGFRDIVDGKQRLSTIIDFVMGKFADSEGFYWDDLSTNAQRKFMNFQALAYGEIGDNATDEDVKAIFLGVNFTGVQMSQDHINFVKNINL